MIVATALSIALLSQANESPVDRIECPRTLTIPMEKGRGHAPYVNVEIGGEKYRFVLDTGAVGGRLPSKIVDRLQLKPVGKVRAGDPSGKNAREVSVYKVPMIKVGGATIYGARMFSESNSGPMRGQEFDGVLGYGLFRDVLLTLDYPNRQIVLNRGGMTSAQSKKSVPYQLDHGMLSLDVQVGKVKVLGHIDSGSDGGLSIPAEHKSKLSIEGEPVKVGQARTLYNSFDIFLATVKDPITVGGVKMPIDKVEIHDMFPISNIGGRVLSKFKISIDQKAHRILFEGSI